MKKLLLLLLLTGIISVLKAQPSSSAIIAKIKKDEGAISVKLRGNGISETEFENGKWVYYFRRSYNSTFNTKYKGVKKIYSGGIQYKKVGGKYVFDRYLLGKYYYEGVQIWGKDELLNLLKSDIRTLVKDMYYYKIVDKDIKVRLAEDPEWDCSPTSATFFVIVTYTAKYGNVLETAEHKYKIWANAEKYHGKWIEFQTFYKSKEKVLSTKKYSQDEIDEIKTLGELEDDKILEAEAKKDREDLIPVGDIPKFDSGRQLGYFLHNIILTKNEKEIKSYIYKMLSKGCYVKNSDIVLTKDTKEWIKYLLSHIKEYRIVHCKYPTEKEHGMSYVRFLDKENSKILSFYGVEEDGTYKINEIDFYAPDKKAQERMKNNNSNCQDSKPDLTIRKIVKYNVGDKVNAKFKNGTFASKIEKIDPYNRDRYYIKLLNGGTRGYWMEEKFLSPYDGKNNDNQTTNKTDNKKQTTSTQNQNVTFSVGDKVKVKTTKGEKTGKITKITSNKYLVKFNDIRYGEKWVAKKYLIKK